MKTKTKYVTIVLRPGDDWEAREELRLQLSDDRDEINELVKLLPSFIADARWHKLELLRIRHEVGVIEDSLLSAERLSDHALQQVVDRWHVAKEQELQTTHNYKTSAKAANNAAAELAWFRTNVARLASCKFMPSVLKRVTRAYRRPARTNTKRAAMAQAMRDEEDGHDGSRMMRECAVLVAWIKILNRNFWDAVFMRKAIMHAKSYGRRTFYVGSVIYTY